MMKQIFNSPRHFGVLLIAVLLQWCVMPAIAQESGWVQYSENFPKNAKITKVRLKEHVEGKGGSIKLEDSKGYYEISRNQVYRNQNPNFVLWDSNLNNLVFEDGWYVINLVRPAYVKSGTPGTDVQVFVDNSADDNDVKPLVALVKEKVPNTFPSSQTLSQNKNVDYVIAKGCGGVWDTWGYLVGDRIYNVDENNKLCPMSQVIDGIPYPAIESDTIVKAKITCAYDKSIRSDIFDLDLKYANGDSLRLRAVWDVDQRYDFVSGRIHRNGGIVTFKENEKPTITWPNGDRYVGEFSRRGFSLLEHPQIRLWEGTLTKANGTIVNYKKGISDEQIQEFKNLIANTRAKYTKKYGANYSNSLSENGNITNGMPIAFIKEYVNDYNKIGFYAFNKQLYLSLNSYQPTVRDMTQFGRGVQIYKLFMGQQEMWKLWVLNGKVVATSRLNNLFYINMNWRNYKQ